MRCMNIFDESFIHINQYGLDLRDYIPTTGGEGDNTPLTSGINSHLEG